MTITFDRWELMARIALGERGIDYHEATPLIQDARSHYEQSGADPWQALGTPEEFAADVAADRPAAQARRDTQGKTPSDHLRDGVFGLAFLGVPASLLAMWVNGLTIPLTAAGSLGTILLGLSLLAVLSAPGALRAAGHPRLAPWGFAVGAGLAVAAAVAFVELPRDRIGETPALGLLVVSLGFCWLLSRPGRPSKRSSATNPADPSGEPDPADPEAKRSSEPDPADPEAKRSGARDPADPEAWFARLHGLLAGRFDVPSDRATALVDQARAHVEAAGTLPQEEFPSLAQYARDLAEQEPHRQPPWWRRPAATRAGHLAMLALVGLLVIEAVLNGDWWVAVTGAALVLWLSTDLWPKSRDTARS